MSIRGVIFDLGHTLMHLQATWPEVFEQGVIDLTAFLAQRRPDLDRVAFCRVFLDRRKEAFDQAKVTLREVLAEDSMRWTLAQFGAAEPDRALVMGAIDAFFAYEDAHWTADPEALATLQALAGRELRLGLFSNATHHPFIEHVVDRLEFRPWLDPVLSSAAVGIRKPDPAAFAPFLTTWGVRPEEIVVVGDQLDLDVLGAQRAGMHSVWYPGRTEARQEGDGAGQGITADAVIERLGELPSCLLGIGD